MLRPLFITLLVLTGTLNCFPQTTDLQKVLSDLQEAAEAPAKIKETNDKLDDLKAQLEAVDIAELSMRLEVLEKSAEAIYPKAVSLAENLGIRVKALEDAKPVSSESNPYVFVLKDTNGDGDVDEEWEEIIRKGQEIQAKVWVEKEKYWTDRLGTPPANQVGWYGTSTMPVIQIVCAEGEYFFHNTARLPGRFQITCPTRWGSMLRFYGDGDKVLVDDIAYGVATKSPIGIYVEPKTEVTTPSETMVVKPFEQQIERVIIVAMKGVMPVYLAQNQDRFTIKDCNIQQHQGSPLGIKHGPPLQGRSYPFSNVTQILDGNTYLADPRVLDCQFEGPHSGVRKQAAIFMSGNNMIFSRLNFYGWTMGVLCHGGQGRVVDGLTMHDGMTADGRRFTSKNNILAVALSTRQGSNPDSISGVAGGFKVWALPKRSPAPETAGWYVVGEGLL